MNQRTSQPINQQTKSPRDGFGAALLELGQQNPQVVALTADLGESVRMEEFAQRYPERFVQVGIAEQNMAGIAAGLALSGKTPFMGSFVSFQPMRNLDQIRTSICMMNANVKIVSSHAGFSHPSDGIQVQALEDIAIMRVLPNMTVLVPADFEQARELTLQAAKIPGPVYLRLGRSETPSLASLADAPQLEISKGQEILTGRDAYVIATGYMVAEAFKAIQELKGSSIGLLNIHTIKPLDAEAVMLAAKTGKVLTIEEHQRIGGLGGAVAEVIAQAGLPVKLKIVGVDDQFGETSKQQAELWESRGIGTTAIVQELQKLLAS